MPNLFFILPWKPNFKKIYFIKYNQNNFAFHFVYVSCAICGGIFTIFSVIAQNKNMIFLNNNIIFLNIIIGKVWSKIIKTYLHILCVWNITFVKCNIVNKNFINIICIKFDWNFIAFNSNYSLYWICWSLNIVFMKNNNITTPVFFLFNNIIVAWLDCEFVVKLNYL